MPDYNKVILMGNLTRDPELKYTSSNKAVLSCGMAINRKWKSQDGSQNNDVTFVDFEAWGRLAEVINQYLGKGDPIFVEGRLKLDQWEQNGQKRSKLKVVAESMQFVKAGDGSSGGNRSSSRRSSSRRDDDYEDHPVTGNHVPIDEDSIPF